MPTRVALLSCFLVLMMACSGNASSANAGERGQEEKVEKTFRYNKGPVFTAEERAILDKAKRVVKEKDIDVSGLDERIVRDGQYWVVLYTPPGYDGPGGAWEVKFTYPSGKFVRVYQSQ